MPGLRGPALGAALLGASFALWPAPRVDPPLPPPLDPTQAASERAASEAFDRAVFGDTPPPPVDELLVLRRASLGLLGVVPSLERTQALLADPRPDRLEHQLRAMVDDPRFRARFAQHLMEAVAGPDGHAPLVYRGDRLRSFFEAGLRDHRSYGVLVRELVGAKGLWTGAPASNFITAAFDGQMPRQEVLTTRISRAFLGERMDCAACHDHPFTDLSHEDFVGLASFFGETQLSFAGVVDRPHTSTTAPRVPFGEGWLPAEGSLRDRLAAWLTHPQNLQLRLAIANRAMEVVFGRGWIDPVDDLPEDGPELGPLTVLADDLRAHGDDLDRLVRVLIASHLFRAPAGPGGERQLGRSFPITRLEPETVARSLVQVSELRTAQGQGSLLIRAVRFAKQRDFVEAASRGSAARAATIPEILLVMNGDLASEAARGGPLGSIARIAGLERDDLAVRALFLTVLTRAPREEELRRFTTALAGTQGRARTEAVEDALWALLASPELTWSH